MYILVATIDDSESQLKNKQTTNKETNPHNLEKTESFVCSTPERKHNCLQT